MAPRVSSRKASKRKQGAKATKANPSRKGNPDTKTVMLPPWMKTQAHAHASAVCRQKGIRGNPSTGKGKDRAVFDKAVYDFCLDAYRHSLTTPKASRNANPYSPRLPVSIYEAFPEYFGVDANIARDLEGEAKKQAIQNVKSSVSNLATNFMKSVMKTPNAAFEFLEGMSSDDQKKVIINQYRRMYVALKILTSGLKQLGDSKETILRETENLGVTTSSPINELRSKGARAKFVTRALAALRSQ